MRLVLFISLIIASISVLGQESGVATSERNPIMDSLKLQLQESLHDTMRAKIKHSMAREIMYSDPDSAIALCT